MSWETIVNADFGKYRIGLQNASISPLDKYSIANNACQYYYNTHSVTEGAIVANPLSAPITLGDIAAQEWANLFGFKLYQNGVYTNKVAMLRGYCIALSQQAGNLYAGYTLRWAMFDETTHNYTWLADYGVDIYMEAPGSIQINSMKANIVFQTRTENITAHGGLQRIIYGGMYFFTDDTNYGSQYAYVGLTMQGIGEKWHLAQYDTLNLEGEKKSPEYGTPAVPAGGYNPDGTHGTFDNSSDVVPVPHLPTKGVTSAGFINVYVIDNNQLATLGEKLFPHFLPAELLADPSQMNVSEMLAVILKSFFGTLISPVGSTIELADNLGIIDILMNGKLIDYVLDCHIIPTAISGATVEGLKVGYRQFNDLQLAKATTDYVEIDCGELSIGEYWANFLDYASQCSVKLFLPFVGFVPLENEYWNGGTIKVIYHFNIIDGSFQAYVVSTSSKSELSNSVIAQYGGVCCVHMPITGLQYSNVVAGLVNGTAGAVAKGSGGDVAGAVTNAMNMAMLRPDAPSSNGYNASSSFLSERTPYLLIERPTSQFSEMYDKEIGLPLNVMRTLSTVHGFTVIDNPVLHISCSDSEYQELVSLLKNGVILP